MRRLLTAIAVVGAIASRTPAQSLTTIFTYQGSLASAGAPANGVYDLRFTLYSAVTGGAQVGATQCADNASVANGNFSVQVDFGVGIFAGQRRWLEVQVRQDTGLNCANTTGFTTLSPRAEMTATPYALYSLQCGTATNSTQLNGQAASFYTSASNLTSGTLPSARLGGTYAGVLSFTSGLNAFTGNGAGLTNLNATNIASGTIASARLPNPLTLIGADVGSIIRADNSAVSNGASALRGSVTAATGASYGVHGTTDSSAGRAIFGIANSTTGTTYGVWGQSNTASTGYGVFGLASATSGFNVGVAGESDSPIGIGVSGVVPDTTGANYGVYGLSFGPNGYGVFGQSNGAAGYGVFGQTMGATGVGVYGKTFHASGATAAGWFETSSTAGRGAVGSATAASGVTYGLHGRSASTAGTGVYGEATAPSGSVSGVLGRTANRDGYGVQGFCDVYAGGGIGVYGHILGAGKGVYGYAGDYPISGGTYVINYGLFGETNSNLGVGVYGVANLTDLISGASYGGYFLGGNCGVFGRGAQYGGRFENSGSQGTPLYATTTNATYSAQIASSAAGGTAILADATASSGATRAVHARAAGSVGTGLYAEGGAYGVNAGALSVAGVGVQGTASAGSSVNYGGVFISSSTSGRGVYGAVGAASGTTYGVYGTVTSGSGFAVYALGNTGASGTKSFRIDHPADPRNKYLLHYAVESPEVLNSYSGKVVLDDAGEAAVALPDYFSSINRDPRYTLTPIGAPMPALHVAQEISDEAIDADTPCTFRIAGGVPRAKVSWEVKALRDDRWVRTHGAPVVAEKQGPERGRYQHPELYGEPLETPWPETLAAPVPDPK